MNVADNIRTIAFVHGEFPCGGAEKVTLDVSEYLCSKGFRVIVLCRHFRPELMPEGHPAEVVTYRYKLKKKESVRELADIIRSHGIQILAYVCIHPLHAESIRKLTGVRLVSANHGVPFWQAIGKNAMKENLSRGSLWQRLRWRFYYRRRCQVLHVYDKRCREEYRRVLAEVDAYTVLCDAYREELVRALQLDEQTKGKIHVIPNYQQPNDHPRLEKEKVVLFVGRLTYSDKRVDRLIRVWAEIEPKMPDWKLEIVGDGEEREPLRALADELGLKQVSFEGRQQPQPYYDHAAIQCLTSTIEGWGLVITEAQTNGVVPIAFDCSAGVETLISPSGVNGILVPPFDEAEFAQQLLRLMEDEDLRLSLQQNVLKRKYPKEEVCQRYCKLYEDLLAR